MSSQKLGLMSTILKLLTYVCRMASSLMATFLPFDAFLAFDITLHGKNRVDINIFDINNSLGTATVDAHKAVFLYQCIATYYIFPVPHPGVNFINVIRMNFSYGRRFFYVHVTRENNVHTKNSYL